MPYPENFIVRLLICLVGMFAIWFAATYVIQVLIQHDAFTVGPIDIIVPAACGVVEAFVWKPKEQK